LSLLRSRAGQWQIPETDFKGRDIHIHVPAGGIPKDGPSAGVAMLVALVSLVSETPTDPRVAMTGEITLRGHVLPVGGIKEKVLAAHRAGVKKVVVPARNETDLEELPEDVRDALTFVLATRAEDVLAAALPDLSLGRARSRHLSDKKTRQARRTAPKSKRRTRPTRRSSGRRGARVAAAK
jgi:ATP-dependent Lon protease